MSKTIVWTPESEKTFAGILSWLEKEWNDHVLLAFLDKVDQVLALIAEKPELYPAIDREKRVRKCVVVKQVSLFYTIKQDQIDLLTFWDNRQNPERLSF